MKPKVDDAVSVVNAPVLAVVEPIAFGFAQPRPTKYVALRLVTVVVLATIRGAVPVATVETKVGAEIPPEPL